MRNGGVCLCGLVLSLGIYSCGVGDPEVLYTERGIEFVSEILNKSAQTRAFGTSWEADDRIGVFVAASGAALSDASVVDAGYNVEYKTSGNGSFVAAAGAANYPADNSKVDIVAYYPYKAAVNGCLYDVDVTDQSAPGKIDLMWSNNIVGASAANPQTGLRFAHQLSKICFNVKAGANTGDLRGLTVSAVGFRTRAGFNLSDGTFSIDGTSDGNISFKTTVDSGSASAEAVVIPEDARAGRVVTFTLPSGESFRWEMPSATKLEKGGRYTWTVTLDGKAASAAPERAGYIETPAMTNIPADATYIKYMMPTGKPNVRNYAMLYDKKYMMAYWVAYPMHDCYLGSSGRNEAWAYGPGVGQSYQPYLKNGFGGTYDRGHQIPSADRTVDVATNRTTFYFTNMTAQVSSFNQGTWNALEGKIRAWTGQCDTLYVVTGAMPTTATDANVGYVGDNNGKQVAVPKYHFKALAKRTGETYCTVAFKMGNSSATSGSYNNFRMTVAQLEKETGFTFFPQIPAAVKNTIETSKWN